ncbi:peptidase M15 [Bacillus sp. AFS076308]|uniref:M15 family metallopeptidase n=1 Tax=unclassified Bacillus (in: firmicutes) TaxID=185979 RepID=UPI000BF929AC|nr:MULTISPECIES: M15 family metallopeptidase [unclassified Bacillus (in: firmicutes)]PFN99615.1 peptidase M15 [Bacillus sp. AFS076308]PGV50207.1 peptidase M15 [Bacillus sp. AFS037270]
MKLKRIGSILFTLTLVLIFILFYFDSKPSTESPKKQSVSMPTELNPVVKERTEQLIQQAAKKGIVVVITDSFRSAEDQDKLYEQGRTTDGNIVTNAKGGESYHNYGLAIDFALETPSGDVVWDREYDRNGNAKADWAEVVKMAKALGFEWGGDWKGFKDYPHLEMNFGLTIADLQNGERPAGTSLTADLETNN